MKSYPYKPIKLLALVDEVDAKGFYLRVGPHGDIYGFISRGMVEAADRDRVVPGSIVSFPARRDTTQWRLCEFPPATKRERKRARIKARQWLALIRED